MRELGIRGVIYVDDIWITASTYELALKAAQLAVTLLSKLGFILAMEKGKSNLVPTQVITFLGTIIDSVKMEFRVPKAKIAKFKKNIERLISAAGAGKAAPIVRLQQVTVSWYPSQKRL